MAFFDELQDFIVKTIKSMAPPVLDPSKFNDPVALKTSWSPLVSGGANFKTRQLVEVSHLRMEFQASGRAKSFGVLFILIGSLFFGTVVWSELSAPKLQPALLLVALIPLVFVGVGWGVLKQFSKPIFFDKSSGFFGEGNGDREKTMCSLRDIHALQIIKERVRGNKRSYSSFELNLVLKDGTRRNVVDHGSLSTIQSDALEIVRFIGSRIPIWDATQPQYLKERESA